MAGKAKAKTKAKAAAGKTSKKSAQQGKKSTCKEVSG